MLPLRDHNPSGKQPFVTYFLIAVNVLVFIFMLSMPILSLENFIQAYSLIPKDIVLGKNYFTLLTSMFLHGSVGHLFSNMLFLNIFGDNLEDKLGHFKFLFYYLMTGLGASALQIAFDPASAIPNLGASGAIAGVMGGYLLLFPRHRIDVLFTFGFYFQRVTLPAYSMLVYWFIAQLLYGVGDLALPVSGGIAFFAHIGGFVTGYSMLYPFKNRFKKKRSFFNF
jgi:membrane associated rhomboid family serine protease